MGVELLDDCSIAVVCDQRDPLRALWRAVQRGVQCADLYRGGDTAAL